MLLFVASAVFAEIAMMLEGNFFWHVQYFVTWDNFLRGSRRTKWRTFPYKMRFLKRQRQHRQMGGLQTDGLMVGLFSDHAGTRLALGRFLSYLGVSLFVAGAFFSEADVMLLLKKNQPNCSRNLSLEVLSATLAKLC